MSKNTKIVSLFDRNKENYAQLLMEFIKPVKDEYDGTLLIEIGISAWNTSNMIAIMPEHLVDHQWAAAREGAPEDVIEVLDFLIKRKKKYFAKYDLFIFDFELIEKTGKITVQTMPFEEYIVAVQNMLEEEMPDDIIEGMFDGLLNDDFYDEFGNINREAVLIQAKAPFIKYLVKEHGYDLECDSEFMPSKIILFYNKFWDFDVWVENSYKKIMASFILDFIPEEHMPKRFSFKKFKTWFSYKFVDEVIDFEDFDDFD